MKLIDFGFIFKSVGSSCSSEKRNLVNFCSVSIQDKVAMRQVEEKGFMTEWDETRPKIEDWLSNAESEAAMFDKAHDTIVEVEEQVAEHEVISI